MVSFGKGRRCGAMSIVEQDASAQATATADTMPTARFAALPRMTRLIRLCPRRLPISNIS